MAMWIRASLLATLLVAVSSLIFTASTPEATAQKTPSGGGGTVGMYSGPGGCAASNCHGSVTAKAVTRIWQNEYSIWAAQDKHARAYNMLSNPVSMRMGKILKLASNPNQAEKCLVCHSINVASNLRAQSFQMDEGVSCENCHGPAVGWLGPHTTKGWTHEQSLKLGMYDARDLAARSEKCMSCHVGTPDKRVDHQMIAAGHPDLTFELDTFSAVMPRHWKFPDTNQNTWEGVQEWAIGQGVELRETLNRLSRSASSPKTWPEFAELECFACHHSLTQPQDSWRQAAGYQGRTPGAPAWNASRYIVFRDLVKQISPDTGKQLDADLDQVSGLVGSGGDREQIAAAAKTASTLADQILQQVRRQQYDASLTTRVMQAIAADGNSIAEQGERSAEQAAMALDSLALAYEKNEKLGNQPELRAAIDRLFKQLSNPSAYNAPVFAVEMQKVKALLPHGIQTASSRP
jgi:Cytochrome c554 and c-prime